MLINIKKVILKFTEEEIKKNENTQHVKKIVDKGIQDSLSSILDKRYRFK